MSCVTTTLAFAVPGQPIPKARARSGNGTTYTPRRTRAYEDLVRTVAQSEASRARFRPLAVPCAVELHFRRSDRGRADLDNLAKSITDAIIGVAYDDDRRIERLEATVIRGYEPPGVYVAVRPWRGAA